jgi:hypothetical protein
LHLDSGNSQVAKVHDALSEAKLLQGAPVVSRVRVTTLRNACDLDWSKSVFPTIGL